MVKDYNELKDIAKKLMLENNYGIKEEELIYVTTTDITDYYEKISSRDKTVLSEVYGTEELPLIHHYITRAYAYDVFNLYFGDFMKENKFDATTDTAREAIEIIANGMTGAQIKELFNSYVCYMVSEGKEFNLTDIFDTKVKLFESFNQIDETNNSLTSNFENAQAELYKILRA